MTDEGVVKYEHPVVSRFFGKGFLDRFFGDFRGLNDFFGEYKFPKSNVSLVDGHYKLELELPGFEKDEIKVSFDDGRLEVAAKKETKSEEEKEGYSHREFTSRSYQRTFALPVLAEGIEAKYEKGILYIDAKADEVKKPGKLEIKVE